MRRQFVNFFIAVWCFSLEVFSQVGLNLRKPSSVAHMFGATKQLRSLVLLDAAVTYWSIWLHRNDFVFEKKEFNSRLQVIYAISHMLNLCGYPSEVGVPRYDCDGIATMEQVGRISLLGHIGGGRLRIKCH